MVGDKEMRFAEEKLTAAIIQAIIRVHRILGPGFVESVYQQALIKELRKRGLVVETEKRVIIYYEGEEVGMHRLDIVVEGKVIVELKTVDDLSRAHYAQVRSYLKAADLDVAILVNFSTERADYRRVERSSPYPQSSFHPPSSATVQGQKL